MGTRKSMVKKLDHEHIIYEVLRCTDDTRNKT